MNQLWMEVTMSLGNELRDLMEAEEESGDENDEKEMESAYSQEEIELPKDWSTDVPHEHTILYISSGPKPCRT